MPDLPLNRIRQSVYLFLDESGTSASDPLTLVGATAYHDVGTAEAAIRDAYGHALGNSSLWTGAQHKRERFLKAGFHFTEDNESVRNLFLATLETIDSRAYAAYAKNDGTKSTTDLLIAMYGTLLSSVLARYRDYELTVVFEQNPEMDPLYGKIWSVLQERVDGIESAVALRGSKNAPCLAATDYVLGVTRVHLAGGTNNFEKARFVALGGNYAYLINFDDDRHLGGRKHAIV